MDDPVMLRTFVNRYAEVWCRYKTAIKTWLSLTVTDLYVTSMKIVSILTFALTAACCIAAHPTWNPADAAKEAEQDIRSGNIKFYWPGNRLRPGWCPVRRG